MTSFARQQSHIEFEELAEQFEDHGYALTRPLLTVNECNGLIQMYQDKQRFRSRVVMQRHNFGRGEYQYFANPLPELVQRLRESFYEPLAQLANRWAQRLNQEDRFPPSLIEFLDFCGSKQQTLPTPLMLRYQNDDYNCLHQDLYGEISFPLQAACVLSQHGRDYEGGEFLLNEQRPRAQTRGEAITIEQGQFIIFPNRYRPVHG